MNQDQVKEQLLMLDDGVEDFTLLFSGKSSKKVDGLYQPEKKEIVIHNENHANDNAIMYTAIHEFAHHIQFTTSAKPVTSRSHTNQFWDIFHRLLFSAEELGIYTNVFDSDDRFVELTRRIKDEFLNKNANLMIEFGEVLLEAKSLCFELGASFEDYVDRALGLHRNEAKAIMRVNEMDIDPRIGFENMKKVATMKDEDSRKDAEVAFLEGHTPDMVQAFFSERNKFDSSLDYLLSERDRLEKSLEQITVKLAKVERQIQEAQG